MENKNEVTVSNLVKQAADFVSLAQEQTGMSAIELAAMFRICAAACDEAHNLHERALMVNKIRGWSPGK